MTMENTGHKPKIAVASYVMGNEGLASPSPTYQNAVAQAGGLAFLTGAILTEEDAEQIYQEFDGLILAGGADINSEFLQEPAHEKCECATRERDITEMLLAKRFLAGTKPVLAICRGEQILNIAAGGRHNQHIFDRPEVTIAHQNFETRHPVKVVEGTFLSALFQGATELTVNSTHHQAVRTLAEPFTCNATSPDGVIEGYEYKDRILGTQWHPERMLDEGMKPIFDWLIQKAAECAM